MYGVVLEAIPSTANTQGTLHIRPLATLSGGLDAALAGDILAHASMSGSYGDVILTPPGKGSNIVVLLRRVKRCMADRESEYIWIPRAFVSCFPVDPRWTQRGVDGRPPLFEVTGFDDPKVTETIENLRVSCAEAARGSREGETRTKESRREEARDRQVGSEIEWVIAISAASWDENFHFLGSPPIESQPIGGVLDAPAGQSAATCPVQDASTKSNPWTICPVGVPTLVGQFGVKLSRRPAVLPISKLGQPCVILRLELVVSSNAATRRRLTVDSWQFIQHQIAGQRVMLAGLERRPKCPSPPGPLSCA